MKFAGGDQRCHAAVHVVGDPAERILRRRVFADGGMGVRVDQAGNRRNAVSVDDLIGGLTQTIANGLDHAVLDENRVRLAQRALQLSRDQRADVFDEEGRHAATIAKGLLEKKSLENSWQVKPLNNT